MMPFLQTRVFLPLLILANLHCLCSQPLSSFCGTSLKTQQASIQSMKGIQYKGFRGLHNIPVQIHMVLNDNGGGDLGLLKLRESICTLNQDFESIGFQFYMESEINYIKSSKYNEHNYDDGLEMMRKYNVPKVINVYIVGSPAGNCGYFTNQGDAVALSKSCLGKNSHTWAHEFGHYFSLPHTFFGWEGIDYNAGKPTADYQNQVFTQIENTDRRNCLSQADNFCDTPPDYISNRWSCNDSDSSSLLQKDVNGQSFRSDGSLFMSYALDNCMSRFSDEQKFAMQNNLANLRTDLDRSVSIRMISNFDNALSFPPDSATTSTKVRFSWNPVANADGYVFQLSRNQPFTVLIRNVSTINSYFEVDSLIEGKRYFWRVIPYSKMDFCTEGSVSHTFEVNSFTKVNDAFSSEMYNIFPNPARIGQNIYINRISDTAKSNIRFFSDYGKDLTESTVKNSNIINSFIQTEALQPGIYFIQINERFVKIILTH